MEQIEFTEQLDRVSDAVRQSLLVVEESRKKAALAFVSGKPKKCDYCTQPGESFSVCKHCGAPIGG